MVNKYLREEIKGIIVEYTILPIKSTQIFFLRGVPKPNTAYNIDGGSNGVYTTDIVWLCIDIHHQSSSPVVSFH